MDITKRQINQLGRAMMEYDQLVAKDKDVKVTEARMLHLSFQVKYAILKNWQKAQKEYDVIQTTMSDTFKSLGGSVMETRQITFLDLDEIKEVKANSKMTDEQRKSAIKKLKEKATANKEKYDKEEKTFLDGKVNDLELHGLKPTERDIQLLPEALIMIYMDLNLLADPIEEKKEEAE